MIEAEKNKAGVELNSKEKEQNFDEVVSGRMTFPDKPPCILHPYLFPKDFEKPSWMINLHGF